MGDWKNVGQWPHPGWSAGLMSEEPLPREDDGNSVFIRRGDALRVPDRSARLGDRPHARFGRLVDAVTEWKEGIRSHCRAGRFVARQSRLVNGHECGVDAGHL